MFAAMLTTRFWLIFFAAAIALAVPLGIRQGFGLFVAPWEAALTWPRATFSLAFALQNLIWGAAMPFAAAIAERYGTGRVVAGGAILYAAGTLVMAEIADPLIFSLGCGLLVGAGMSCLGFGVLLPALARAAPVARRSQVLGWGSMGGSMGLVLLSPFIQQLIDAVGWREAMWVMAGTAGAVALLAPLVKGRPAAPPHGHVEQSLTAALAEAAGHRSFLLLSAGFFVCGFHLSFVTMHLPPYLASCGMPATVAGIALSLVGVGNLLGTWGAGQLGARYRKSYLLSAIYALRGVLILGFVVLPVSPLSTYVFAFSMGLLWLSTVPLTSGLVLQMFGPRWMGTLFGVAFFSHQIGGFLGAWLGGQVYDMTGSYDLLWWVQVAMAAFGALINLPIVERPVARLAQSGA